MNTSAPKLLFVASTGGHLTQLLRLSGDIPHSRESMWMTFRTPQSESLLAGRRATYVPYVKPRDAIGVIRASGAARKVLKKEHFDRVISTGAGVALAVLPLAHFQGVKCTYIESVSRVRGPSLTGRIIEASHIAELFSQHPWGRKGWTQRPSVFGHYARIDREPSMNPSLLVTLGTIEGYSFASAVEAVLRTGMADERTVWQLGDTPASDLPGTVVRQLSTEDFVEHARNSDVVVTHAGVGTLLELFELGKFPVVLPRKRERREHVDNHQEQIASLVESLDLGVVADPAELTQDHIRKAARHALSPVAT